MAAKTSQLTLTLVVILMTWHDTWAQSGCSNALMGLSPCLKFATGNSTKPSPSCCSSLMGVVQTQPQCLCAMINGGGPMAGIAVNQTLAMALPAACNMQTPPISQCSSKPAANGPSSSAASPESAPIGSPLSDSTPSNPSSDNNPDTTTPTTPSQSTTPSSTASGSKTVPSTTGASSGAITITSPIPITMLFVLIFSVGVTRF